MKNPSHEALRSPASWLTLTTPLVVGLAADLLLKSWSAHALVIDTFADPDGVQFHSREVKLIPGFLHLLFHSNHGAVFGIGQGNRFLFIAVSVMALALLGFLFARSGRQRFYQVLLGMLAAGVLGNFIDRVYFGYVRDMIYALPDWGIFPWIFNIADSLLCTGVGGMFVYSLFHKEEHPLAVEKKPA